MLQQQAQQPLPPPPPLANADNLNLSNVLHFLQTEWRRYERDRNEWEIERAEMRVRATRTQTWRALTALAVPLAGAYCPARGRAAVV